MTPERRIPAGVWALGMVSLFMDLSSELIHALLPVYLVTILGTSMITVGVIEGIAEATASITKVFSGALSDRLGRRKELVVLGYGLAAITKPVFALATTVNWIVAARFVDRIGKGIRGAPRDALIADLSPEAVRGASFGLRQSLDTMGAFLGPLLAIALMWLTSDDIRLVFAFAAVPAFIAVGLLIVGVREPAHGTRSRDARVPLSLQELRGLGKAFHRLTAFALLFSLARFSEAFLILKADASGLPLSLVPAVLVVMNLAYAAAAYPAGALSDRVGRIGTLAVGLALLIAAHGVLAVSGGLSGVTLGVVLWGLHMAFTQSIVASLVADFVPAERRGTAYGIINLVTGLGLLSASLLAGALWDAAGPSAPFLTGAGLALACCLALPRLRQSS